MSYRLYDATLEVARVLGDVYQGTATGGTTTTLVDSTIPHRSGWFNDPQVGTLWVDHSTVAVHRITGHTTTTLTFSPAVGVAYANGTVYYAAPGFYPYYVLRQAVNHALRELGPIPMETIVTATADQHEYDNTDNAIFDNQIVEIQVAGVTGSTEPDYKLRSTEPLYYRLHSQWNQVMQSTRYTLIFEDNTAPDDAYQMRITYLNRHPVLSNATDIIYAGVCNPERIVWQAAVFALKWRFERVGKDDPELVQLLNFAMEQATAAAARWPIRGRMNRAPRMADW